MRFLVDANLPRSTLPLLARFEHTAEHVRDIGLGDASDTEIAARARKSRVALITRDVDFADVRRYPPADYSGIVVMRLPEDAVAQTIMDVLERFLNNVNSRLTRPGISSSWKHTA